MRRRSGARGYFGRLATGSSGEVDAALGGSGGGTVQQGHRLPVTPGRRLIQERTHAGLAAARSRGRLGGRKPIKADDPRVVTAKRLHKDRSLSIDQICGCWGFPGQPSTATWHCPIEGTGQIDGKMHARIGPGTPEVRKAMFRFVVAFLLTLALLSGCGAGNEDNGDSIADAICVVEAYVCTDEYEKARELSVVYIDTVFGRLPFRYGDAVFSLWDGTPFVVDISSTFTNAERLLAIVAREAERIHAVLGYEIFVAGDVLPLADVTESQIRDPDSALQLTPPDQHIDILCCYDPDSQVVGVANRGARVVVLTNDPYWSRHAIIHEMYHILGFVHPDQTEGVVMSEELMYGAQDTEDGIAFPTQSAPIDLAKLACIYD